MKTRFLLLECFGAFPGSSSANWYLSDGGHFENTGAYALLRQEAALIVIADCGADPDYRFCDLEILIRRARIDLNAEITFMKPRPDAEWTHLGAFGSLNDLASPTSQACLALAQVRYASGQTGQIVLVKPNVSASLPVDLVNFKAANPLFPQQPTTDQFFDEAQWESYFRLGSEIGYPARRARCSTHVAQGAPGLFVLDDGQPDSSARGAKPGDKDSAAAAAVGSMSRLQARVLKAGAVTASIGIGTAATFGVAAWQGIDSWRAQRADQEKSENGAFKDLTERWARLHGGGAERRCAGPAGGRTAAHRGPAVPRGQRQLHGQVPALGADRGRRQAGLRGRGRGPALAGVRAAARSRQRHRLPAAGAGSAVRAALLGPRLQRPDRLQAELQRHLAAALAACRLAARPRCRIRPRGDRVASAPPPTAAPSPDDTARRPAARRSRPMPARARWSTS